MEDDPTHLAGSTKASSSVVHVSPRGGQGGDLAKETGRSARVWLPARVFHPVTGEVHRQIDGLWRERLWRTGAGRLGSPDPGSALLYPIPDRPSSPFWG